MSDWERIEEKRTELREAIAARIAFEYEALADRHEDRLKLEVAHAREAVAANGLLRLMARERLISDELATLLLGSGRE
jgi:hypothetical protein